MDDKYIIGYKVLKSGEERFPVLLAEDLSKVVYRAESEAEARAWIGEQEYYAEREKGY